MLYLNRISTVSHNAEYLKATLRPDIYVKEAMQIILERKQKFPLKDIIIKDFKILRVFVSIVDEERFEMQQFIEEKEIFFKPANIHEERARCIKYPLGSVLAQVAVMYESEDIYDAESEEPLKNKKFLWCYEACISGHVDLAWQVVQMSDSPFTYI